MATLGNHEEENHFVRALSHDMSATFMLLEDSFARLKRSIDDPIRRNREQLVDHVEACLQELRHYLDDLSGLAKTGRVALEPSAVDSGAVLNDVLFEQRDVIQARGVQVNVRRPLPVVWCNAHRLREIFANLLRNAAIHGCDSQSPALMVSAEPVAGRSNARFAAIRVHDNGSGIDPRFHEEIFLPGRRLSGASSEGSGMGLAIVKKVIEYYGGQVYVDPRCQSGTAIVFSLPIATSPSSTSESQPEKPTSVELRDWNLATDTPHKTDDLHAHQVRSPSRRPTLHH